MVLRLGKAASKGLIFSSLLSSVLLITACSGDSSEKTSAGQETPQMKEPVALPSAKESQAPVAKPIPVEKKDIGWQGHLLATPKAFVPAKEPVRIQFSHAVSGENALNVPKEGLLSIEPKLEHRVYFDTDRSITIEWEGGLDRRAEYQVTLFPNHLDNVSDNLKPYEFSLKAFKQDFGVQINGLQISGTQTKKETQENTITGYISLNDSEADEAVNAMLSATQADSDKTIEWDHQSANKRHVFTIKGVERGETASAVNISWNGKSIGVDKSGNQVVEIPALSQFDITGILGHQTSEQYIEISFSNTLKRKQNLKGLISIDGIQQTNTRIDGNKILVYPRKKLSGDVVVTIASGVVASDSGRLEKSFEKSLTFLSEKPAIRFSDKQYILPKQENPRLTIEAVNVDSVQVTAYRTPVKNIGQFLQTNQLRNSRIDTRTATLQWRKTFDLPEIPRDKWQKFDLDLAPMLKDFDQDLLALQVKIDRSNIILDCGEERPAHNDKVNKNWQTNQVQKQPDWVNKYYNTQGHYDYRDWQNPCKERYYQNNRNTTQLSRYVSNSNIAIIAKMAVDHQMNMVLTDINTAEPLEGASVKAYNYQHQPVAQSVTNEQGMASFYPVSPPHYLIAEYEGDVSFLTLQRNTALSTNVFDVGGSQTSSGLKGFFYGERGVWRPGDNIFLTFIAEDKTGNFPENYPLTLDFFDPKGVKKSSVTQANPIGGFYHFKLATPESAITGNWRAVIRYGSQYFDKQISVEAIVPNRLKIELEFPKEVLSAADKNLSVGLFSQWLNGATANQLKADVKYVVAATKTRISGFDSFLFDDPTRKIKTKSQTLFDGKLSTSGKANFKFSPNIHEAPGQVNLTFTSRVFEKSGNFSTQYVMKKYTPYDKLVGMLIPQGRGWNNSISRNEKHNIQFLSVDAEGERQADRELDFMVYRVGWRWWWDYSREDVSSYINSSYNSRIVNEQLQTDEKGMANWELDGSQYDWGRYLLRVCDKQSRHCSGKIVYLGWSYNQSKNPSGASQLMLSMDKKKYTAGDVAYLTVPQTISNTNDEHKTRLLLTLESGTKILSQRWIESELVDNRFAINITEDMAPNVYAHVSLIQPYATKQNDSPIRMYGITPIFVENTQTQLKPVIDTQTTIRPESKMNIKVTEENGQAMTYTLAVVDEGLLGVTNYHTPNPHKAFYKREALGVLTWDIYGLISNTNARAMNSLISLGGGDSADEGGNGKKRRFPPVVKFIGPFNLDEGETAEHNIQLPEYMGAVRVMIVAGNQAKAHSNAYGVAEQEVKVTQPLTLLATLPRVLGPNEEFALPVSVFANTPDIKKVSVSVEASDLFEYDGGSVEVNFDKPGDKIIDLPFKTKNGMGTASVVVKAEGHGESISQTIHIPVRAANSEPEIVKSAKVVEAGQQASFSVKPNGMLGTNQSYLEISRVPDFNISNRLDYLIRYPHGCLEQTTSKLFPQVFLKGLIPLTDKQQKDLDFHIREGIHKLSTFQQATGAFNYWPNGNYYNTWSNNYAGHFLLEAKRLGYVVPNNMLDKWLKSQQRIASESLRGPGYESTRAYTLYTLALAGKADFSAMNRLKQFSINEAGQGRYHNLSNWLLAAAYAKAGAKDAAQELMQYADVSLSDYEWSGYTYGSSQRDRAIYMLVQKELGNNDEAWKAGLDLAEEFRANNWYSTHTTAWVLLAMSNVFADDSSPSQELSYKVNNGPWQAIEVSSPILKQVLSSSTDEITVQVKNESANSFHATLGNAGIPANAEETAFSKHIEMDVRYTDMQGAQIDISKIKQGTDFKAIVTVRALNNRARFENIALTMVTPSGWQISNSRLEGKALPKGVEYQDIRDDRVYSYFTLGRYYWYHRYDEREVTIEVAMNASFKGKFYLPGWHAGSMYDRKVRAKVKGQWIEVLEGDE